MAVGGAKRLVRGGRCTAGGARLAATPVRTPLPARGEGVAAQQPGEGLGKRRPGAATARFARGRQGCLPHGPAIPVKAPSERTRRLIGLRRPCRRFESLTDPPATSSRGESEKTRSQLFRRTCMIREPCSLGGTDAHRRSRRPNLKKFGHGALRACPTGFRSLLPFPADLQSAICNLQFPSRSG